MTPNPRGAVARSFVSTCWFYDSVTENMSSIYIPVADKSRWPPEPTGGGSMRLWHVKQPLHASRVTPGASGQCLPAIALALALPSTCAPRAFGLPKLRSLVLG
jgi:hypothetical protein